jgi:hypothetical protein
LSEYGPKEIAEESEKHKLQNGEIEQGSLQEASPVADNSFVMPI